MASPLAGTSYVLLFLKSPAGILTRTARIRPSLPCPEGQDRAGYCLTQGRRGTPRPQLRRDVQERPCLRGLPAERPGAVEEHS